MYNLPPDPYATLAVPKDADDKAIKLSYRKLILTCHPDKVQDPELKAQKQAEFQQVQQAYELLNNPEAKRNYDRKARANEEMSRMPAASPMSTRTPPRNPYPDVNIRTAEPRSNTFSKSGPSPASSSKFYSAGNTSSRSWEEELGKSYSSKKSGSDRYYEYDTEEKPSKRDSGRSRRRADDSDAWERERARAERDHAEEKKKSKEKKSHERNSEKKKVEKERKRDGDDKRHGRSPYMETFPTEEEDEEEDVTYAKPPKSDRKKSSSSRKHDDMIRESARMATTERERKNSENMDSAIRYLERSGGGVPSFVRAKSYHATPAVPTPPPAHSAVYPPPPPPQAPRARDVLAEDDMGRRSSAKASGRRMSNDTSKSSRDKSSAPKKSSTRGASREPRPVVVETGSPQSRPAPTFMKSQTTSAAGLAHMVSGHSPRTPGLARASTDHYPRSQATPSKERAQTWYPGTDRRRKNQQDWKLSEDEEEDDDDEEEEESEEESEESSEEEPVQPQRRSRRTRSPEPVPPPMPRTQTTYKVSGGKTAARQTYAPEPTMSKKDRARATYAAPPKAKANMGAARAMDPMYEQYDYEAATASAYAYQAAQTTGGYGVNYSPMFDESDIQYAQFAH